MRVAIDETRRRRDFQNKYNLEHNIITKTIIKEIPKSLTVKKMDGDMEYETGVHHKNMTKEEKVYLIAELEEQMRA
jgi:excinuclease ABC subunit B